jgi:hypothetical protein
MVKRKKIQEAPSEPTSKPHARLLHLSKELSSDLKKSREGSRNLQPNEFCTLWIFDILMLTPKTAEISAALVRLLEQYLAAQPEVTLSDVQAAVTIALARVEAAIKAERVATKDGVIRLKD